MKRWILIVLLIALFPKGVSATDVLPDASSIENNIPADALSRMQEAMPDFSLTETVDALTEGNFTADFAGIIKKGLSLLFSEVSKNFSVCGAVLLLAVICSLFSGMQASFSKPGTADAAFLCCFALVAGLLTAGFNEAAELTRTTVDDMIVSVQAMIPALTSMSIATGAVISAPVLHTVILMAASICSSVVRSLLLPLTYAVFALQLVDSITGRAGLKRLAGFLKKTLRWTLGLMMTLFTSGIAITGFAAGSAEGIGGKAARYAVSSLIPVAGGALSDTVSALASSAAMIRNATGIGSIILICVMLFYPLIKALALTLLYNALAAVLEPVADERFSRAVAGFGDTMAMLFGLMAVVAAMMVISVAILLAASGIGR